MNKKVFTLLLIILMSMTGLQAIARWDYNAIEVDGLYYYLDSDSNCAQVASGGYSGNITIPSSFIYNSKKYSVTSIGISAFWGCSSLTSVTIPNSVSSIEALTFHGCSNLSSLMVESGNVNYDSRDNCNAIIEKKTNTLIAGCPNTVIPNSVTSIGSGAFCGRIGLISVTIPSSVTSIGGSAFENCYSLTSVTIPNSVTSIGGAAFRGCSGLTSVTIGNSVTSIGGSAFSGCSSLTSVTIPNSVTSIGDYAFRNCSSLTSISLNSNELVSKTYTESNNIKYIFGNQVESYIIGDDVTSIGEKAFYDCSNLTSVAIPSCVTSVGEKAFANCSSLTVVNIADVEKWSQISFGDSDANPLYYAKCLYLNDEEVTKLELANDVSNYAFINCIGLTDVDVKGVGTSAFKGCSNITSVKVDCETVENWFADSKTKVQTLTLGENVTTINANTFYGFNALKNVYLGSNLAKIGTKAFANCGKLENVYCFAVRYPTVGNNTFENSYIDYVTLHVPAKSVNQYKSHDVWGKFMEVVPITDEEVAIEGVTAENAKKAVIYNLNGQRISSPKKGINIINGRKVLTR